MSLFRDIFDAFHGRMPKRIKDEHITQVWPHHPEIDPGIKAAQEEDRRQSRRGKHWEFYGDRLHIEGFPITIRRATADEMQTKSGIFCVECDTLPTAFVWDMEDAKFVGERWAREIDALPLNANSNDPGTATSAE